VYNRLTEPFQMMKTVISATEWENFFWLRNDKAADPTLEEVARSMYEAREQSVPTLLKAGDWHLPYVVTTTHEGLGCQEFWIDNYDGVAITPREAIKVSAARTAAVSFRNEDYGLEKCLQVYDKLVGDQRKHASAMAHQATPMKETCWVIGSYIDNDVNCPDNPYSWESGISHADREGNLWSAQFKGWIMHRKLIEGENKETQLYKGSTK